MAANRNDRETRRLRSRTPCTTTRTTTLERLRSTEASFAFRFRARRESDGHHDGYAAKRYTDGYTGIEWRNGKSHGGWLAKIVKATGPWDPAAPHSFRVLAVGSKMRLYLDGALVGSFDDSRFGLGHIYTTLSGGPEPIEGRIFYLEAREGRLR